jgi:aspartyl-tRNA(Asn)/glutamyl-tRNA(Gln) amidotransferase subunit C
MATLTRDDVAKVALLSRLQFDDATLDRFAGELSAILEYVEQLRELDLTGIEPTSHALELKNVLRDDTPRPSLSREEALANAPDQADGCFRVPAVLKGASS